MTLFEFRGKSPKITHFEFFWRFFVEDLRSRLKKLIDIFTYGNAKKFAHDAEIPYSTLKQYLNCERTKFPYEHLYEIDEKLNFSMRWLLKGNKENNGSLYSGGTCPLFPTLSSESDLNGEQVKERLTHVRMRCCFTPEELAKKVGINTEKIKHWEKKENPPANMIEKLSKALNISPYFLAINLGKVTLGFSEGCKFMSDKVFRIRAKENLTTKEFADKLGRDEKEIKTWEEENLFIKIETLKDIASKLNKPEDSFLIENDLFEKKDDNDKDIIDRLEVLSVPEEKVSVNEYYDALKRENESLRNENNALREIIRLLKIKYMPRL